MGLVFGTRLSWGLCLVLGLVLGVYQGICVGVDQVLITISKSF